MEAEAKAAPSSNDTGQGNQALTKNQKRLAALLDRDGSLNGPVELLRF